MWAVGLTRRKHPSRDSRMARRKNYAFERNQRAKAKAAKREAKREAKAAARIEKARNASGGEPSDSNDPDAAEDGTASVESAPRKIPASPT